MDNLGDLSAMLSPLLNDPDAMKSIRQAAEQMGLGGLLPDEIPEKQVPQSDQPKAEPIEEEKTNDGAMPQAELLTAVARLAPLLSAPQEDDTTRLLTALRPFLSESRVQKLDKAERLLSLTRVLSILKESKLM